MFNFVAIIFPPERQVGVEIKTDEDFRIHFENLEMSCWRPMGMKSVPGIPWVVGGQCEC